MNTKIKFILVLFAAFTFTNLATAQKTVEHGHIHSKMEIIGMSGNDKMSDAQLQQIKAMLQGSTMDMYFSPTMVRTDVNVPMSKTKVFINTKTGDITTLMDIMGQKKMMKDNMNKDEEEKGDDVKPEIIETKETKKIAGHKCKKVIIKTKDAEEEVEVNVYYAEDIAFDTDMMPQFKGTGIKGMPLEYDINQGGMKMKIIATEVELKKQPKSTFEIPTGYTEMSKEELMQMGGGQEK